MENTFPFMHPWNTQLYLWLLMLTLVLHVVFMNYVLAGSIYLAVVAIFRGRDKANYNSLAPSIIRDWMTFYISMAITMGIAPLLFIQILYQKNFYTANLLLFNRWMFILPVLMVGIYCYYVVKSHKFEAKLPGWLIAGITVLAMVCILFTGLSWTENYLISVAKADVWKEYYLNPPHYLNNTESLNRLGIWIIGAFPTLSAILGWQLYYRQKYERAQVPRAQVRLLSGMAAIGLTVAAILGYVYLTNNDYMTQPIRLYLEKSGKPYFGMVIVGAILTLAAWVIQWFNWRVSAIALAMASIGTLVTITGATILREAVRTQRISVADFYEQHIQATQIGGLYTFVFFLLLNCFCIFICFLILKQAMKNKHEAQARQATNGKPKDTEQ